MESVERSRSGGRSEAAAEKWQAYLIAFDNGRQVEAGARGGAARKSRTRAGPQLHEALKL